MKRRMAGFSLVEVAIALGLVGFVLVALLGLFSTMLDLGRTAREALLVSTITSSAISKYAAMDWVDLAALSTTTEALDSHGTPVGTGSASPVAYEMEVEPISPSNSALMPEAATQLRHFRVSVNRAGSNTPIRSTPFSVANYE